MTRSPRYSLVVWWKKIIQQLSRTAGGFFAAVVGVAGVGDAAEGNSKFPADRDARTRTVRAGGTSAHFFLRAPKPSGLASFIIPTCRDEYWRGHTRTLLPVDRRESKTTDERKANISAGK